MYAHKISHKCVCIRPVCATGEQRGCFAEYSAKESIMRAMTMDDIISFVIRKIFDGAYDAQEAIHKMWFAGQLTFDQHGKICHDIDRMSHAAVEKIMHCNTPQEIEEVMQEFKTEFDQWAAKTEMQFDF